MKLGTDNFKPDDNQPNNIFKITINIDPTEAAIEPFLINPDGLNSDWPMMKILFQNISNPGTPPKITSITIELHVTGVKTFQLYNDFGELNTKNPFTPFGPIPLVNANFIIGNNEILSKPLDSLTVEIDWDKRPADFEVYYKQYNDYLYPPPKKTTTIEEIEDAFKHWLFPKIVIPKRIIVFTNASFTADFNIMKEKSWQGLKMTKIVSNQVDKDFVPVDTIPQPVYLFDLETGDTKQPVLSASSSYYIYCKPDSALNANTTQTVAKAWLPDPNIQKEALKFTEASSSGFIKMTLHSPDYGFGSELYANVVASIALQNGDKIARARRKEVKDFLASANVPFAPKIKTFSAIYTASVTYKFDGTAGDPDDYPLQYFIYSPFSNYTLFDSTKTEETHTTLLNTVISGISPSSTTKGLPLYPSFDYSGALFIELDNLICNSTLNLYFELARNSTALTTENTLQYYYLSDTGWNKIQALSDETSQFRCSGIIELPIPADCNNNKTIMPGTNNWISIAVTGKPESFSKTTFMQTNGFSVQRTGSTFLSDTQTPQIEANAITKPEVKIPEIGTLLQPFPSFGGKAAESKTDRNKIFSNSIKTKNRPCTSSDYYSLIAEKFDSIYFSKVVTKKNDNSTNVYLVKKIASDTDTNAFIPLVTNSLEIEIEKFLNANSSPFVNLQVSNFNLEYVRITAKISVKSGYQVTLIEKKVNRALKVYLSPWIANCPAQIEIDKPLVNAKASTFIQNIEGVATVESVLFSTFFLDAATGSENDIKTDKETVKPHGQATLLISAPNHNITFLI